MNRKHDLRLRSLRASARTWLHVLAWLASSLALACTSSSDSPSSAASPVHRRTEPAESASTAPSATPKSESVPAAATDRWEDAIRAFEAADAVAPPPVGANLFLGSSSIRMWDLAADFPGFPVVQRGFGGSEVADSVRYAPRLVLPCKPRVIVFYAGDNDVANGKTPERVAADFDELVAWVHRELPDTRIVFVSIKPSTQRWALADAMRRANELVRELATRDPLVDFVDVWPVMLGVDGRPRAELFVEDGLHLSRAGYREWTELVRPFLVR